MSSCEYRTAKFAYVVGDDKHKSFGDKAQAIRIIIYYRLCSHYAKAFVTHTRFREGIPGTSMDKM